MEEDDELDEQNGDNDVDAVKVKKQYNLLSQEEKKKFGQYLGKSDRINIMTEMEFNEK